MPAGSVRVAVRQPLRAATRPIRRTRQREPSSTPLSDGADRTPAPALHQTTAQPHGHAPGSGRRRSQPDSRQIRQRKRLPRIRRSTGTWHIPSHDREVIGKVIDLWPPGRASIPHEPLRQKRRPFTRSLISDTQAPNIDLFHQHSNIKPRCPTLTLKRTQPAGAIPQKDLGLAADSSRILAPHRTVRTHFSARQRPPNSIGGDDARRV
jgi:hypothetical protein